jgi:tetratricopeptide (TPR) repeat protein
MKTLILPALFSLAIVIIGCQQTTQQNPNAQALPELLMRSKIIGPENEMAYMLDQYTGLKQKIEADAGDLESRLTMAELFMMEARISGEHGHYYPAALQLIDYVLQQKLKDPVAYRAKLDKASVLLSLHQFEEAKAIGLSALALNPHSADIYGVLVDANVELGQYQEAISYADKMVSIRPDLRSYSRISYLREIHGMVDESIAAMKMAVAAGYPGMEQTEWARLTLGHLYQRYGMQDSAMIQYQTALAARPHYPFAISAIAEVYAARGETAMADSLNTVAMELIPEVGFYVSRASWEKDRGNLNTAKDMTKEIMTMLAEDEEAGHKMNLELARVHLDLLDKPERALVYAIEEYTKRPDNIDVNKLLAEIYFLQNNLSKAEEHMEKALKTGTMDPEVKCLEGILLAKGNQLEEGSKLLKSVFVENPHLDCSFCTEAKAIIL